jgi:hypothetical protein
MDFHPLPFSLAAKSAWTLVTFALKCVMAHELVPFAVCSWDICRADGFFRR